MMYLYNSIQYLCINILYNIYATGIDNSPSNVTTVLGDIAEFQCSAFCGIVAWLVNETSVFSLQQNHNLSYLSGPRSDGVHGETSTLQIVAEDTANNTMIRCIVIDPDYNTIINSSTSVYLRVQGMVVSVITSGYLTCTHEWMLVTTITLLYSSMITALIKVYVFWQASHYLQLI